VIRSVAGVNHSVTPCRQTPLAWIGVGAYGGGVA
jgi:hypothetical protein